MRLVKQAHYISKNGVTYALICISKNTMLNGYKARKYAKLNGYKVCGGYEHFDIKPNVAISQGWELIELPKGFRANAIEIDRLWGAFLGKC